MPYSSYSQDILTRIYNVHWGGGVFIAINSDGNIYYLELMSGKTNEEPVWLDLGTLDFVGSDLDHFTPFPASCSYGMTAGNQPMFIIVGGQGNETSPGIIMASKNGKDWSQVFTFEEPSDTFAGARVWACVWDEDARMFFAAGHQTDIFFDHEAEYQWQAETDLLFSSADGLSWSEDRRNQVKVDGPSYEPLPPWPDGTAGLLDSHCSSRVVDDNGYNVPDGNYGYDKGTGLLIQPGDDIDKISLDYLFGQMTYSSGSRVDISVSGGDGPPPSYPPGSPGLSVVTCVATAGGEWVAAGGKYDPAGSGQPPQGGGTSEAAYLATDDAGNQYWRRIDPPGSNAIIAMCGGLLSADEINARLQR